MPEPLRIPASKKKGALMLLGCIVFAATGWFMRIEQPVFGWCALAFFAAGIPVSLYVMFSKQFYLLLDERGFEMGSPIKTVRVGWDEVDGFELVRLNNVRMIAVDYNERYRVQRLMRGAAKAVTGVEGVLPNHYTRSLDEVFALLVDWHRKYGRAGKGGQPMGAQHAP